MVSARWNCTDKTHLMHKQVKHKKSKTLTMECARGKCQASRNNSDRQINRKLKIQR